MLTNLALNKSSVDAVLKECRTYIRHDDKNFVKASVRAVGKIANSFSTTIYDDESVAMNVLKGLLLLIVTSQHKQIVGEAVNVCRTIMQHNQYSSLGPGVHTHDPENYRNKAMKHLILLLFGFMAPSQFDQTVVEGGEEEEVRKKGR